MERSNIQTEADMREYCDENAGSIYIRERMEDGKVATVSFDALTEERKREWCKRWFKRNDKGGV